MDNDYETEGLTFEEVLDILEEELLSLGFNDNENPYRPLNFHDPDEGYEE
jgi:hypothetical protein